MLNRKDFVFMVFDGRITITPKNGGGGWYNLEYHEYLEVLDTHFYPV